MTKDSIRTRYAPSPTGYMHIGNLRTALYEYLTAKHEKGVFILRIEDTDQKRHADGAIELIYKTLKQAGLLWDEGPDVGGNYGPYIQSKRMGLYKQFAEELVNRREAYYCFCELGNQDCHCRDISVAVARETVAKDVPYVIRQKMPATGITSFDDMVYGRIEVDNSTLEDQILIKTDGMPTYNFANVVDDHLMEITYVIRGNEYLSSTPKYNLLYQSFGWNIPKYIHCPPVMKDANHKLSKRNGDASFEDLIAQGFLSEAILNYLLLLGWTPKESEREFFTLQEMVEAWDPQRINKSPAIFDIQKLKYFNAIYIRNLSAERFKELALPWIESVVQSEIDVDLLCKNLQPRCEIFGDIPDKIRFIEQLPDYDLKLFCNNKQKTTVESSLQALQALLPILEKQNAWRQEAVFDSVKEYATANGVKNGWLLYPLGIALSGMANSPGGGTDLAIITGKDKTLSRIKSAIHKISCAID